MFITSSHVASNQNLKWKIFYIVNWKLIIFIVLQILHLESSQRVYFTQKNAQQKIQNPSDSTLAAFFKLCLKDDFAEPLFHKQVHCFRENIQKGPIHKIFVFRFFKFKKNWLKIELKLHKPTLLKKN